MVNRLVALGLLQFCVPASAHDIYDTLLNSVGGSCCHSRDCHPVMHRITPEGVQMLVNGVWRTIPKNKIQYRILPGDNLGNAWQPLVRISCW
jgi:hypothetical protein